MIGTIGFFDDDDVNVVVVVVVDGVVEKCVGDCCQALKSNFGIVK